MHLVFLEILESNTFLVIMAVLEAHGWHTQKHKLQKASNRIKKKKEKKSRVLFLETSLTYMKRDALGFSRLIRVTVMRVVRRLVLRNNIAKEKCSPGSLDHRHDGILFCR